MRWFSGRENYSTMRGDLGFEANGNSTTYKVDTNGGLVFEVNK